MCVRPACLVAVCVSAACVLGTPLSAQSRFVLGQHVMAEVSGLPLVTIRDTQLSACYTRFAMEPATAPTGVPEPLIPTRTLADKTRPSVLPDVEAQRERQFAELKAQFAAKTGRTFDTWHIDAGTFGAGALSAVEDYERARAEPIACTTRRAETTELLP